MNIYAILKVQRKKNKKVITSNKIPQRKLFFQPYARLEQKLSIDSFNDSFNTSQLLLT